MTTPVPTPDAYTTCIACGCWFWPPNGTELCGGPLCDHGETSSADPPG